MGVGAVALMSGRQGSNLQGRAYLEIGETVASRAPATAICCVYQFRHAQTSGHKRKKAASLGGFEDSSAIEGGLARFGRVLNPTPKDYSMQASKIQRRRQPAHDCRAGDGDGSLHLVAQPQRELAAFPLGDVFEGAPAGAAAGRAVQAG